MESDNILEDRKNHNLELSILKNTTKKNEIHKSEDERINANPMSHKNNQIKDIKKIKSIRRMSNSNGSDREYLTSHPRKEVGKSDSSHKLNKIHKLSKPTAKKKHKNLNKVTKVEAHNSDSFYTGAIVGSFLGAVISSAITKFLTEIT